MVDRQGQRTSDLDLRVTVASGYCERGRGFLGSFPGATGGTLFNGWPVQKMPWKFPEIDHGGQRNEG